MLLYVFLYFCINPKLTKMRKIILIIGFTVISGLLSAQIEWTKYDDNFVLTHGPDNFDIFAIGQPCVLYEEGVIRMWYPGVGNDGKARLCYATSTDGIEWTKYGIVMDVGGAGEWDRGWIDTPDVVKTDDGYVLVYYGDTIQQLSEINSAMGVAYSPDGITWIKDAGNPVFSKAEIGDWDGTWVESPTLFWDDANSRIMMFYNGIDTATWKIQIGLAFSDDGSEWTRYEGNPVISSGDWGDVDDMWCGTPSLLYRNGKFEMWYASTQAADYNELTYSFDNVSVCFATSDDGIDWTKHPINPLFDTYTEPHNPDSDLGGPWAPDVIFNDNTQQYMMWYEAHGGDFDYGFSLATAPIDFSFTDEILNNSSLIVYPNPVENYLSISGCNNNSLCQIRIFNALGEQVFISNKFNNQRIDVTYLQPGLYFIEVKFETRIETTRFVKS
jgi:predicted GH43/DUF377 family glycosyl hydrolase